LSPQTQAELKQIRCFLVVAQELHFSRAARRLHIAQPALSRQIRQLEHEVGALLLFRSQRSVELTPAGRAFLPLAQQALEQVERAVQAARTAAAGAKTRISIGLEPCADYHLFPEVLQLIKNNSPEVMVDMYRMATPDQIMALREGRIVLGFVHPPVEERDLRYEPLYTEVWLAAVSASHVLAKKNKIDLSELRDERFLLWPRELAPACYDQVLSLCRRAGFEAKVAGCYTDFRDTANFIAAGQGVALLPSGLAETVDAGVRYLRLSEEDASVESGLLYLRTRRPAWTDILIAAWKEVARGRSSTAGA
jgi:DNA-binding transcriptional LysR family regulator